MKEQSFILLVDDNLANLRIGMNAMEGKYNVFTAPSAKKMFDLLEDNRPDLILLDIDMPEMCGYEAIKALKSKPETKDIPIIFLTSRSKPDEELKGLTLGAIDYIVKPYDPRVLIKRIEIRLAN